MGNSYENKRGWGSYKKVSKSLSRVNGGVYQKTNATHGNTLFRGKGGKKVLGKRSYYIL